MRSSRAEDTGRTRHRWRYIVAAVLAAAVVAPLLAVASPQPAAAAGATVTASGRFVYIDGANTVGISFATVDMCDADQFGCSVMGTTTTDADGNFTVVGTGGDDFGDLPDPRVRVFAASSAGRIGTSAWPHKTYCFESSTFNNLADGDLELGTISTSTGSSCHAAGASVASEAGAWQIHNSIEEAWSFTRGFSMSNPGRDVPSVDVRWPSGSSGYDNSLIGIAAGDESQDNVVWHEYGHFVMEVFAESPRESYSNGICDTPQPGHCVWMPENGSIHFTEGWPDYFADAVSTSLGGRDLWSFEDTPQPPPTTNTVGTEGYTAAILWDLDDDTVGENHDGNSSIDRLEQGFATQWAVLTGYDPAPADPHHDHPTSIVEFWDGVKAMFPSLANRLSAIYDENEVPGRPSADLVSSVTNPPASIVRGNSFTVTSTVRNTGQVDVGEGTKVELFLWTDTTRNPVHDLINGMTPLPDMRAGQGSQTVSTVTVPATTAPGQYHLMACVDRSFVVFEQDDANNCTLSSTMVKVKGATPARHLTVWRPNTGEWFTLDRQTGASSIAQLGSSGDVPVAADYDGDGKNDPAVFLPAGVGWYIRPTSTGIPYSVQGDIRPGDVPVPADYDGDGKAETAVWRPSDGTWRYVDSSTGVPHVHHITWGGPVVPVPADYDGDGKADQAVWRPSDGSWYVISSSTGTGSVLHYWGQTGDVAVPADYDGDGKTDVAVWRPGNGAWYVISSLSNNMMPVTTTGQQGDIPVPADHDGDGKADRIVFGSGAASLVINQYQPVVFCRWFSFCRDMRWTGIETATGTTWGAQWGVQGDVPVPRKVG